MKRFLSLVAGLLLGVGFFSHPVAAAEPEVLSLEERVERLEALLGLNGIPAEGVPNSQAARPAVSFPPTGAASGAVSELASAPAPAPQIAQAAMAAPTPAPLPSAMPAPAADPNAPIWSFANNRATIRSPNGDFDLAFRGRLQFDSGSFFQNSHLPASVSTGRDLRNGAHFRRAQFGVEGQVFRDFEYEFVFDFGSSGTERAGQIYLMRLAYTGIPNVVINGGAIQPKFTLDDSTSSADLTFMERASIVNTLLDPFGGSDSRRGIEARYQKEGFLHEGDNLLVSTAFTGERIAEAKADDEGTQWLGRIAYRFYSDEQSSFQVGVNAARILNQPDAAMAFNDRPETRVDGTRLVGFGASGLAPSVAGKSAFAWGVEAAANYGPFTVQGEYFRHSIDRMDSSLKDPSFSGWYMQASYFLTGEQRPYNAASAAFGSPAPRTAFARDGDGWGAWEVKARYSVNDLDAYVFDANPGNRVRGGEQRIIGTGLNWYMNRNVRWLFDYSIVDIDRLDAGGLEAGQDFQVLGARMQFSF